MEEKTKNNMPPKPKAPPKPLPPRPAPVKVQKPQTNEIVNEKENILVSENLEKEEQTKKTKQPKPKKQKSENAEKEAKTKKAKVKFILIIIAVIAGIILAATITVLVLINKQNNKKLSTPTLQVIKLEDSIILKSSEIKNSTKYEFVITYPNGNSQSFYSTVNECEISKEANVPGKFLFKTRAYGKGKKATSNFSEIQSITNYQKLESPSLNIYGLDNILENGEITGYKTNQNLKDDYISWQKVNNAASYDIYYGVKYNDNGDAVVLKTTYSPKSDDSVIKFYLEDLYGTRGAGLFKISVVSVPEAGAYFEQSADALLKNIEYHAKQDMVTNAKYSKSTKTLTFSLGTAARYGGEFDLYINGDTTPYKVYTTLANITESNNKLTFTISLIELKADIDVVSMSIITVHSGAYTTDSGSANVDILN